MSFFLNPLIKLIIKLNEFEHKHSQKYHCTQTFHFEKCQKKRNFIPQLLSKKKRKLKETYQNINEKLLIIVYFCCSIKNLTKNVQ
jgi:hypothetical protein